MGGREEPAASCTHARWSCRCRAGHVRGRESTGSRLGSGSNDAGTADMHKRQKQQQRTGEGSHPAWLSRMTALFWLVLCFGHVVVTG